MTRAFEVSYDGTAYAGWQVQENARTIQGVIEQGLETILKHEVHITYAGRTDAGVHALGQVISFSSDSSMTEEQFKHALNALFPQDIRVMNPMAVDPGFHPRYDARARWYRYIIWNGKESVPFFRNYALRLDRAINMEKLQSYGERIVGEHDFSSFASLEQGENPVRKVFACEVHRRNDFVILDLVANAFLRKMVRSIVGTFLKLERGGEKPEQVDEILKAKDRAQAGSTAFAGGLYLARVFY
jgi:tRNA pseudouridine38-40 synthase